MHAETHVGKDMHLRMHSYSPVVEASAVSADLPTKRGVHLRVSYTAQLVLC